MAQVLFPVDENSGKVKYQIVEDIAVSNTNKYNRTKAWFMNYYKTSRFEEHFMVSKRNRLTHLEESKKGNSISGKYGFYVMYPSETSSLVIEQVFVMFTMKITFTKTGYENLITDMICYTSTSGANGNMRPVEFGLEAYNGPQLNRLDYVQYYIIPQVNQSIKNIQQDLSRNLRYGNLTEVSW